MVRGGPQELQCPRDPLAFVLRGEGGDVFASVSELNDQGAA